MKIKYKSCCYSVDFLDYIKIIWIKIRLFLKRQRRRIFRFINCLKTSILIFPIWLICLIAIFIIGKSQDKYEFFYEPIWESKYSLISSVLIAACVSLISNVDKFKYGFDIQYELYENIMESFDCFFCFLFISLDNEKSIENVNKMYYTAERFQRIIDQVHPGACFDPNNIETALLDIKYYEIIELLDKVKYHVSNNSIGYCENGRLLSDISKVCREINEIRTLYLYKETSCAGYKITTLSYRCLDVIENLRKPWRQDVELDKKLIKIINKYRKSNNLNDGYISLLIDPDFDTNDSDTFKICKL